MSGGRTERVVKARKRRRCDPRNTYMGCTGWIEPGTQYLRSVAFPGDDVNEGPNIWVLHVCAACAGDRIPGGT